MNAVLPTPTWAQRLCCLSLLLMLSASVWAASSVVSVAAGEARIELSEATERLEDPGHQLTLAQVQQPENASRFTPGSPRVGNSEATWWLRYRVRNDGTVPLDLWFDTSNRRLQSLTLFAPDANGQYHEQSASAARPWAERLLPYQDFVFPVTLPAGQTSEIYLRARSLDQISVLVTPRLWQPANYRSHAKGETMQWTFYLGIATMLALFNLMLYAFNRDSNHLRYVSTVLTSVLVVSTARGGFGDAIESVFFAAPRLHITVGAIAAPLTVSCVTWFIARFLDLPQYTPKLIRATWIFVSLFALVWVPTALLGMFPGLIPPLSLQRGIQAGTPFAMAGLLLLTWAIWQAARLGVRDAWMILMAWSPVLLITLAQWLAILAGGDLPPAGILWASVAELTLTALVVARRFHQEQQSRMQAQVRMGRLKRFFSPQLAEVIIAEGEDALKTHRREVTVVFIDLRGFTAFTDRAPPEALMAMLRQFHAEMGRLVMEYHGTLERFAGDSLMVFFNDPIPVDHHAEQAVTMALAMQRAFAPIAEHWASQGYSLGLGCGIALGEATLGEIGFEGRWDYAAIGGVTNRAARLCAEAKAGEVLVDAAVRARLPASMNITDKGALQLKGFSQPVPAFAVERVG